MATGITRPTRSKILPFCHCQMGQLSDADMVILLPGYDTSSPQSASGSRSRQPTQSEGECDNTEDNDRRQENFHGPERFTHRRALRPSSVRPSDREFELLRLVEDEVVQYWSTQPGCSTTRGQGCGCGARHRSWAAWRICRRAGAA